MPPTDDPQGDAPQSQWTPPHIEQEREYQRVRELTKQLKPVQTPGTLSMRMGEVERRMDVVIHTLEQVETEILRVGRQMNHVHLRVHGHVQADRDARFSLHKRLVRLERWQSHQVGCRRWYERIVPWLQQQARWWWRGDPLPRRDDWPIGETEG